MNIHNIIEKRKKNNEQILEVWELFEEDGKEKVGYGFKILSSEEFNGDLTGIDNLVGEDIVLLDLYSKSEDGNTYKNIGLLNGIKKLKRVSLKKEFLNSISDMHFILYNKNMLNVSIYHLNGTLWQNINLEYLDENFRSKFKYALNIKNLFA